MKLTGDTGESPGASGEFPGATGEVTGASVGLTGATGEVTGAVVWPCSSRRQDLMRAMFARRRRMVSEKRGPASHRPSPARRDFTE
jgi:hypothetical protein